MDQIKTVADGTSRPWGFVPPRPAVAPGEWTAPAPAPTTSAPAVAPVEPLAILDQLVAEVTGVSGAILASVDGFGIAHSSSLRDEASHPAMLAAAVGLAHQLVAMGGGTSLRQLVVDHDGGLLLVWPIGGQRVLAVLTTSTVQQRVLRTFVQGHALDLAGPSS
jgi:predicted regulator of Ras-like GTPase activity (Roadblock/LC7/MglB family)